MKNSWRKVIYKWWDFKSGASVCAFILPFFSQYNSLISHLSGRLAFYHTSTFMLLPKQIIRACLSSEMKLACDTTMMSQCPTFIFEPRGWINKICYKKYDIIDHIKVKIYSFLKSAVSTTRTREFVTWEATILSSCVLFGIWATSSGKTQR